MDERVKFIARNLEGEKVARDWDQTTAPSLGTEKSRSGLSLAMPAVPIRHRPQECQSRSWPVPSRWRPRR